MDVFAAIAGRATARKLTEPGPDEAQLTRILRAGVQAPDHGRLSPWRFVVLTGPARACLGDAMAALRRKSDRLCTEDAAAAERGKAFRAPTVVVVWASLTRDHKIPELEQLSAVAACVQNMLLAARGLGFTANWKTGAAAYDPDVKQALGVDVDGVIIGIVYIGTQLEEQEPRQTTLDDVVVWLTPPV